VRDKIKTAYDFDLSVFLVVLDIFRVVLTLAEFERADKGILVKKILKKEGV
jgi:hypothetical protein